MTDGEPQLDPAQQKAIERIQIIGVFLLIGLTVTLTVLYNSHLIGVWPGLTIALLGPLSIITVATLAASRVERTTFVAVARRGIQAARTDLRSQPARLRRRASAIFSRDRLR
ncbi:MAG: hypothetical protein Q7V57_08760 [Actinomycetota bacterium]|nr:hypothetical protein [Actinomycetota bacterium]